MKEICCHPTLTGLPKHCPKKLNQEPCTICYTAKMTTFPKVTTVDTNDLQLGELIHMDFVFYNVNSTNGFTSMINVVFTKTRMLWLFPNVSKQPPVRII